MASKKNLKPFTSEQSREKAVENGRKGGIASGVSKREKKLVKDYINAWLDEEHTDKSGQTKTGAEIVAGKLVKMGANDGNMKAIEMLLALAGQKPAEKVIVSDIDNDVINEVERMVESGQKTSD